MRVHPARRDRHETRLLARSITLRPFPLPLFRRPPLLFFLLLPSSGFLLLRARFGGLVFEVFGRFALVELLPFQVDEGFLVGDGIDVGGVGAGAHSEGDAFQGGASPGWGYGFRRGDECVGVVETEGGGRAGEVGLRGTCEASGGVGAEVEGWGTSGGW